MNCSDGDETATPLAAPPRRPTQGGYNGGFCIPSCGKVEKKQKKKKKNTTPAERSAAKTKTAHADPPFSIEHVHHLMDTLRNVNESALLQQVRIEDHRDYDVFEKAAEKLEDYLIREEAPAAFWAWCGLAKPPWNEDDGMDQAMAICGVLGICNILHILNVIDNTCRSGSPSDDAELKTALRIQHDLSHSLSWLELPEDDLDELELDTSSPDDSLSSCGESTSSCMSFELCLEAASNSSTGSSHMSWSLTSSGRSSKA